MAPCVPVHVFVYSLLFGEVRAVRAAWRCHAGVTVGIRICSDKP